MKALKSTEAITIHLGIKWVAGKGKLADKIMNRVYRLRTLEIKKDPALRKAHPYPALDHKLAEMMRSRMPWVGRDVLAGKAKRIRWTFGNVLVLSTPPRFYTEWGLDFLKADIMVLGPKEKEREMLKKLNGRIAISLKERKKSERYVKVAAPVLEKAVDSGLVYGVMGRGSYFGANGFPRADDDVNFLLFARDSKPGTVRQINRLLERIPRFRVINVRREEHVLKDGRLPALSFISVSKDTAARLKDTRYEKYALGDSAPLGLRNLSRERSAEVANEFLQILNRVDRAHHKR